MAKTLPAGFNVERIRRGLLTAMEFGEPTRTEDKATFVTEAASTGVEPRDQEGVPFDPTVRPARTTTSLAVPCAVAFVNRGDTNETFGVIQSTGVVITLLDAEYQQVKGFDYVGVGGDRYNYNKTAPPVALGSLDVWTVYATAVDAS